MKFPRRAVLPGFHGASFNNPARLVPSGSGILLGEEKQHLPLDMNGNIPPSLLEALYGLEGDTEQLCHPALRFSQLASDS